MVSVTAVRKHVAALQRQGALLKQIAAAAGVPAGSLWSALNTQDMCRGDFAKLILDVRGPFDPGRFTSGAGTSRRLRGLVWEGWSLGRLAELTGLSVTSLMRSVDDESLRVETMTARSVEAITRRLHGSTPPVATRDQRSAVSQTRNRARRRGYVSLLSWDDIDDPKERPRGVAA